MQQQVRHLNLLEFQSKDLLQKYGVAIQQFKVLDNSNNDAQVVQKFGNQVQREPVSVHRDIYIIFFSMLIEHAQIVPNMW